MNDVIYLARSLGFSAYKSVKKTTWTYKGVKKKGTAFRTTISGDINEIPVKVKRKKEKSRTQKKRVLVTGFKVIEKPVDNYYGFEIDGNRRFLLGDFTVTHNTVCALWIAAQLKKKTLVIVHKEFLLDQWRNRINEFLPKVKVGVIRGKIIDTKGKQIVIGMLQSISMKEYPKEIFDPFGFTVVDECHHISSRTFSQALFKITTGKMLGLSATPQRSDGLTKVIKWFMGDILQSKIENKKIKTPTVEIIFAIYETPPKIKLNIRGKVNLPALTNQFVEDPNRNRQIIEQILKYSKIGRKILVLSDRRNHCLYLQEKLIEEFENLDQQTAIGLYMGGMKEEQLTESNKCDVILATYSMAQEGYDNSKLDTLIMASGKSTIEQAVGRILRKENKFPPLIIDIADTVYCMGQLKKRKTFYKKKKFHIIEAGEPEEKKKKAVKIEFRDI